MKIELKDLFLQKLKEGMHLFTGAGFSVLPSASGEKLPTATELRDELTNKFETIKSLPEGQDLDYVSEFCPKDEYQIFLRNRFTVSSYNPLYDVLNKMNLKTYVTTNIDNIIRLVMDKSKSYYLKSIREYGASMNGANELTYIPLHGDVADSNSHLFFGRFELSTVDKSNNDLFTQMFGRLVKQPVLFWGYSFRDRGVISVVNNLIESGTKDIWIQFLPSEKASIALFREKGCHIIEADTEKLLTWIDHNLDDTTGITTPELISDPKLKKYCVPSLSEVTSIPQADYYQEGITCWHPILTDNTYERSLVPRIENALIKNRVIVISGCKFSGKTTLLMQLARKISNHNKFYLDSVSKEEADFIMNIIGDQEALLFFNNCSDDILAFNALAKHSNIHLIGTADDYHFETVRHLIDSTITYKLFDCTELEKSEAQKIYEKIPKGLKNDSFRFKESSDEKYSMFEFVFNNIKNVLVRKRVATILNKLKSTDKDSFEIIALSAYLMDCSSALSYDNISTYFGVPPYPDACEMVKRVKNYLREFDFEWSAEYQTQDLFRLRSNLFAINSYSVLLNDYKDQFAMVIRKFLSLETPYRIIRYDVFRRKAYDANLFSKLFSKEQAIELYERIYNYDENPYTLQQWALCLLNYHEYKEAFVKIDLAISQKPSNFSFKNSRAIIMFESNKQNGDSESIQQMHRAMAILQDCFSDDKRKIYHAIKYADFAEFFYLKYGCSDYLKDAQTRLVSVSESSEYTPTIRLNQRIKSISRLLTQL